MPRSMTWPAQGSWRRQLDRQLRANPQYAYARDLGQLSRIEPVRVSHLAGRLQSLATAQDSA
jgi:hypothetical protein